MQRYFAFLAQAVMIWERVRGEAKYQMQWERIMYSYGGVFGGMEERNVIGSVER